MSGWFAGRNTRIIYQLLENDIIDRNRIEGSLKVVKGSVVEAAGKAEKLTGKIPNALGNLNDSLGRQSK